MRPFFVLCSFEIGFFVHFAQFSAGEEDAALDGAQRCFEFFCDFVVFIAFVGHPEGAFELFGQGADHAEQFFVSDVAFAFVEDGAIALVDVVVVGRLVQDGTTAHFLAVVVDEDVAHDGYCPGFEVGATAVFFGIREDAKDSILVEVVGIGHVARQLQCKSSQRVFDLFELILYVAVHNFRRFG